MSTFVQQEIFRIDISTSNQIINKEKSALDAFMRKPYLNGNSNLKKIRRYLLKIEQVLHSLSDQSSKSLENDLKLKDYNPNQIKAIMGALTFSGLFMIQGPPGTGKTTVISEIVFQLIEKAPPQC